MHPLIALNGITKVFVTDDVETHALSNISLTIEQPRTYGYHGQFAHFIESFRAGVAPRQTLADGVIDNAVIDAAYRSMTTGRWELIDLSGLTAPPAEIVTDAYHRPAEREAR